MIKKTAWQTFLMLFFSIVTITHGSSVKCSLENCVGSYCNCTFGDVMFVLNPPNFSLNITIYLGTKTYTAGWFKNIDIKFDAVYFSYDSTDGNIVVIHDNMEFLCSYCELKYLNEDCLQQCPEEIHSKSSKFTLPKDEFEEKKERQVVTSDRLEYGTVSGRTTMCSGKVVSSRRGNDTEGNGTYVNPYRTIYAALSNQLRNEICLESGKYSSQVLSWNRSLKQQTLTLEWYWSGEEDDGLPVLEGTVFSNFKILHFEEIKLLDPLFFICDTCMLTFVSCEIYNLVSRDAWQIYDFNSKFFLSFDSKPTKWKGEKNQKQNLFFENSTFTGVIMQTQLLAYASFHNCSFINCPSFQLGEADTLMFTSSVFRSNGNSSSFITTFDKTDVTLENNTYICNLPLGEGNRPTPILSDGIVTESFPLFEKCLPGCPPGEKWGGGKKLCQRCPSGTFSKTDNSRSCISCPLGETSTPDNTGCLPIICPPFTVLDGTDCVPQQQKTWFSQNAWWLFGGPGSLTVLGGLLGLCRACGGRKQYQSI